MTANSQDATVLKLISDLTAVKVEDIRPQDRLREDLGMDSVSSMELISMLTEEFDIDVELEEAIAIENVQGVIDMAQRYLAEER